MKKIFFYLSLCFTVSFLSCNSKEDDNVELPAPPTVTFTTSPGKDANHIVLTSTTSGAFLFQWDAGNGTKSDKQTVEVYYPYQGEYTVKLIAFNSGGFGEATQTVKISQDDPNACSDTVEKLSNCSTKTWKLKPEEGAMTVGTPGLSTIYWASPLAEVTGRPCHFNDEFKFTSKGEFIYDNKGDFWGDADGNGNIIPAGGGAKVGCNDASAWIAPYTVWGSGKHKFTVVGDQLTLVGKGAWMGLYKVGTSAEISVPQESVSFKIIELTSKKLVIAAIYPALEWRFTYESN